MLKNKLKKIIIDSKSSNKKNLILFAIILLIAFIFIFILFLKNDGMEQAGIYNIKYKTCLNNDKCSSWKKNGIISGDIKNNTYITNLSIKIKEENNLSYKIYSEKNGWSSDLTPLDNMKGQKINGISIDIYRTYIKKYDICYRSYNKKDKWLGWSCNGEINGNKDENMQAIQIKMIPKNIVKSEYLENYNISDINNKGF